MSWHAVSMFQPAAPSPLPYVSFLGTSVYRSALGGIALRVDVGARMCRTASVSLCLAAWALPLYPPSGRCHQTPDFRRYAAHSKLTTWAAALGDFGVYKCGVVPMRLGLMCFITDRKIEVLEKVSSRVPLLCCGARGPFRSKGDRDCAVGRGRHCAANRVLGFEDFVFQVI